MININISQKEKIIEIMDTRGMTLDEFQFQQQSIIETYTDLEINEKPAISLN